MGIEIERTSGGSRRGSGGQPSQKGECRKGKRSRFLSAATRIFLFYFSSHTKIDRIKKEKEEKGNKMTRGARQTSSNLGLSVG
jgi:hypothetical protein